MRWPRHVGGAAVLLAPVTYARVAAAQAVPAPTPVVAAPATGGTPGTTATGSIAVAPGGARAPHPRTPPPPPPPSTQRDDAQGVVVRTTAPRERSATEYVLPVGALANVPRTSAGELANLAPGVSIWNDGTEGHAQGMYLRGFSGDDGRDVALSLDGVPLNETTNPEDHGLADLYFIIPELVERLDVTTGVADPRQGDFAVAGSVDFHLGLAARGATVRASAGSFGYTRVAALYGPPGTDRATFVGAEAVHSDGFGPARSYDRESLMGQYSFRLGEASGRVLLAISTGRFTSPGAVREDDVRAGRIGFYGTYPGIGPLGGTSSRGLVSAVLDWRGAFQRAEVRLYAQLRSYEARENFTGFYDYPMAGDLVGFTTAGGTVGANGYYRRTIRIAGRAQDLEVGVTAQHDRYAIASQQLDSATVQPLPIADPADLVAAARITTLGLYLDATARIFSWLTLRGGARFDAVVYDLEGTLGGQPTGHRDLFGARVGPKATVEVRLGRGFSALASHGSGFRSPEIADALAAGALTFATVSGQELGLRYASPPDDGTAPRITAAAAAFHTYVDHDVVFDPTVGDTVAIGATDRWGGALWTRAQYRWLDVNASVTYTHATTEQNALDGRIVAGAPLPYLPPLIARVDAAVDAPVAVWRGMPVRVRGGLGVNVRGAMPFLATATTGSVALLDAQAGVRVGPIEADISARNLLNQQWRDAVYEYASSFVRGATPSNTPAQVFTAGAPLTVFATVGVHY